MNGRLAIGAEARRGSLLSGPQDEGMHLSHFSGALSE
jgi:hypothetical protein